MAVDVDAPRGGGGFGGSRREEPRDRSVFDRNSRFGESRDRDIDQRASNSVFAGRHVAVGNPVFDRNKSEGRQTEQSSSIWDRSSVKEEAPREMAPVVEEVADGPNMDLDRPYDNFWVDGENWQLAHRSNWTWSWSPKQQTRRSYNPDEEVRFLVKSKTGHVRGVYCNDRRSSRRSSCHP